MNSVIHSINELCIKITDGSHFSPENDSEGQYPMYSVKDMDYNGFLEYGYKTIGKDIFEKLGKADCRPLKNDVLIAKDGSYLKYVFKCREDLEACILSSIAILRPNTSIIDPDYFVYLMRTQSIKGAMASYVSGSALPRIVLKDFKKMKLKMIEDTVEQNRIANVLVNYDLAIENNNKRIRILEQIAENLYKEWFVRFRFPGYEHVDFDEGKPKEWEIIRLKDWFDTFSGGTPSRTNSTYYEGNIPWIKTAELKGGFIIETEEHISEQALKESSAKIIKPHSILMAMYAGENVGNLAISTIEATCNQACCVIYNEDERDLVYAFYYLKTQKQNFINFSFGAAQQNISQDIIKKYRMIKPTKDLIDSFYRVIKPIHEEIIKLQVKNTVLIKQRDLLLPRLMSGKLQVK